MNKKIIFIRVAIIAFLGSLSVYPLSADLSQETKNVNLEDISVYSEKVSDPFGWDSIVDTPIAPVESRLNDEEYQELLDSLPEGAVLVEESVDRY